ncbi:MAG: VOC family protein [Chloroflexota bacterium]
MMMFAEVGLRVKDLSKMVAFYQEMLGFEIDMTLDSVVFLKVGELPSPLGEAGHPQLLALFSRDTTLDVGLSTLDHLAFEIPREQYDAELARFQALGMVIRERTWPDSLLWRGRSFFFRDPEGNVIELIAPLAKRENAALVD